MSRTPDPPRGVASYALYGLTLASDFPFANRLADSPEGPPDLSFECSSEPPFDLRWSDLPPAFRSSHQTPEGESLAELYRLDGYEVMRFHRVADFYLWPARIFCHLLDPGCEQLVEIQLLGSVLSYWLERRGIAAIHASAVAVDERAIAFLAGPGGGKTTLAAALMQAGHPLLTDDILPLEDRRGTLVARPGYPQMRMWPESASFFLGHYEDLETVHPAHSKRRVPAGAGAFGSFCGSPRRLAGVYLLQRVAAGRRRATGADRGGSREVELVPLSLRDAVIELVRHSFAPAIIEAVGLQPQRLGLFSRLVQEVPVRRLLYPEGLGRLPAVAAAILDDLGRADGRRPDHSVGI